MDRSAGTVLGRIMRGRCSAGPLNIGPLVLPMAALTPHTFDYAHPVRQPLHLPWCAALVAVSLAICCHYTAFYCGTEEPFLGETDWRDIFALRILPLSLMLAWVAWAILVARKMRPRRLSVLFLTIGVPVAAWNCFLTFSANRRFESDRAQVAEWYQMDAEEEAATWQLTRPCSGPWRRYR
jgi:hypothetical protein